MSKNVILRSMRFTTNVHINCYFLLLSIIVLIHLLVANYIIPFYGIVSEIAKNQKSSNIKHQNNVNKYTSSSEFDISQLLGTAGSELDISQLPSTAGGLFDCLV